MVSQAMEDPASIRTKGQRKVKSVKCKTGTAIPFFLLAMNISFLCFAQDKAKSDHQVNGFSLSQYEEDGRKKWELNGRSAGLEEDRVKINEISALAFGDITSLKLKAKEGSLDTQGQVVHLADNVVIKSTDGTTVTTDSLDWDAETKNVFTEEAVNIRRSDFEVNGKGAKVDLEAKTAELKRDVVANIKSLDAGQDFLQTTDHRLQTTIITCDGPLDINYNKDRATFRNNVRVEDAHGDIFADRIDVYFNHNTEGVRCVVARGNVRIVKDGNITYSEKAIYLVEQGRVILPERPKLVIQNDYAEQQ